MAIAEAIDLTCPSTFPTHGNPTSLCVKWQKWREGFTVYLIAAAITDSHKEKALMFHCCGTD